MTAEHHIAPNRVPDLSDRQRECLRLLWLGHGAKGIARELELSVETVNAHLKGARRILKVNRSADAARILAATEHATTSHSMGTHALGIGDRHERSHFLSPGSTGEDDGEGEVREPRGPALPIDTDFSQPGRYIKGRFDDLTAPHRTMTIVLAMVAVVIVLAGLAAIASSLQTILWAIVFGR